MLNRAKPKKALKYLPHKWRMPLFIYLLAVTFGTYAQNTRGDRPISNQQQVREAKSRQKGQKRIERTNSRLPKSIQTPKIAPSVRPNNVFPAPDTYPGRKFKNTDRASKPIGPIYNTPSGGGNDKTWKGPDNGSQIRRSARKAEKARSQRNVYPQPVEYKKYLAKKSKRTERPWKGDFQGAKVVKRYPRTSEKPYHGPLEKEPASNRTEAKRNKNVFEYTGPSKNQIAKKLRKQPIAQETTASGGAPIKMYPRESEQINNSQSSFGGANSIPPSFKVRGRKNVYWGKLRKKEKPFLKDVAGLELRRKNYSTQLPALTPQEQILTHTRSEKENVTGGGGGFLAPDKKEKGWIGDLSKSKLRKAKFRNTQVVGSNEFVVRESNTKKLAPLNKSIAAKIIRSNTGFGNSSNAYYQNRRIGVGAAFRGNIKGTNRKRFSTESYSYTGNLSSTKYDRPFDQSVAYSGFIKRKNARIPFSDQGATFRGNMLGLRNPLKGGGSVSGITWNNKNKPVTDRYVIGHDISHSYGGFIKGKYAKPSYGTQGASFAGNIKATKPAIGGESISDKTWNNFGESVTRPRNGAYQGYNFAGNKKATKPEIGGESISGKTWNNFGESVTRPRNGAYQGYNFAGTIKAKKPEIGGESISGTLWNNQERSVTRKRNHAYQGYDFAGAIKATKPKIGGQSVSGQLWNNNEKAIAGTYSNKPRISLATSGKLKQKEYTQHPKANIASSKKLKPTNGALAINSFKSKMKQGHFQHKPKAVEIAMLGLSPGKNTYKANSFTGKTKLLREYVHNPKSAALAIKVLSEPKADAKIGDFQGNRKMRKYSGKDLHPDAKFAHLKEDNVKQERTFLTNVKLVWAKVFRKNQNQPEAAKPNEHPLRYDRKEKELWKALYDYNEVKKK